MVAVLHDVWEARLPIGTDLGSLPELVAALNVHSGAVSTFTSSASSELPRFHRPSVLRLSTDCGCGRKGEMRHGVGRSSLRICQVCTITGLIG